MMLTNRDREILKFILDMKFVCVNDIHELFFRNKIDGGVSNSLWYARERLRVLMRHNFLKVERFRVDGKNYYIPTKFCYEFAVDQYMDSFIARPTTDIDIRTFDHDRKLTKCRIYLEKTAQVSRWQSERSLKVSQAWHKGGFSRDVAPDGIYQDINGKRIAFEYEISKKSEARYMEKIKKYVNIMRSKDLGGGEIQFDYCHFVCESPKVENILREHTSIYGDLFTVESAKSFFNQERAEVIVLRKFT